MKIGYKIKQPRKNTLNNYRREQRKRRQELAGKYGVFPFTMAVRGGNSRTPVAASRKRGPKRRYSGELCERVRRRVAGGDAGDVGGPGRRGGGLVLLRVLEGESGMEGGAAKGARGEIGRDAGGGDLPAGVRRERADGFLERDDRGGLGGKEVKVESDQSLESGKAPP